MEPAKTSKKPEPITDREVLPYLIWRLNLGGYDENIAAWRETLKKKDTEDKPERR